MSLVGLLRLGRILRYPVSMHVPDGFLDIPTSIATAVTAAGFVGLAGYHARNELRASGPALPGLTAAFVFAGQMVNFPVGIGTSGHLLGGALAAALVGPWTALLTMTVVLIVQALVFADGGITALGTNVLLMAVLGVLVAYAVEKLVLAFLPKRPKSTLPAVAIGALIAVPTAALGFTGLYLVGGAVPLPAAALATAMVGWHTVIGVGEAIITVVILSAVIATRPDLVYLARPLLSENLRDVPPLRTRHSTRSVMTVGLAFSLIVGGGVSLLASSNPDGLTVVAESLGFAQSGSASAAITSPFAGYAIQNSGIFGSSIAGIVGVLITLILTLAVAFSLRILTTRTVAISAED